MLVGEGPSRPMRTEADLRLLHAEMLAAWQYQKQKGLYSHCLPALLRPSNERSCDERHLVVWCVDHDYKGLGTYFSVLNPEGPGCTTAEVITLFEIDSHYIFDNMFALADAAAENPLEAPLQFHQFAKLWTFSEPDGHQFVIESKKASTRHLPKGFALVGAQLKKTAEGRAILSGLDGQEAHHYFSGHRTRHGGKTSRKKAKVVPTFSTEEQDARYLGSWVWEDMRRDLCKGGRSVPTHEVLDYIRGPHVPPMAKQKLIEHGVWAEFEEDSEEDGNKISVDHIVPHDWMGTDHPMNYFLLPRSLNSQLHTRGVLADDGRGRKVKVTKKQLVGLCAYNIATSFHRLSLAVEQGILPVDRAMHIAREKGAQLSHTANPQGHSAPTATAPPARATKARRSLEGADAHERTCKRAKGASRSPAAAPAAAIAAPANARRSLEGAHAERTCQRAEPASGSPSATATAAAIAAPANARRSLEGAHAEPTCESVKPASGSPSATATAIAAPANARRSLEGAHAERTCKRAEPASGSPPSVAAAAPSAAPAATAATATAAPAPASGAPGAAPPPSSPPSPPSPAAAAAAAAAAPVAAAAATLEGGKGDQDVPKDERSGKETVQANPGIAPAPAPAPDAASLAPAPETHSAVSTLPACAAAAPHSNTRSAYFASPVPHSRGGVRVESHSEGAPCQLLESDKGCHCVRPPSRSSTPPPKSTCVESPSEGAPYRLRRSAPPFLPQNHHHHMQQQQQQQQQQHPPLPSHGPPSPRALHVQDCGGCALQHEREIGKNGTGGQGCEQQPAAVLHALAVDDAHAIGGSKQPNWEGPAQSHEQAKQGLGLAIGSAPPPAVCRSSNELRGVASAVVPPPATRSGGSRDLATVIRAKLYKPSARMRDSSFTAVPQQARG